MQDFTNNSAMHLYIDNSNVWIFEYKDGRIVKFTESDRKLAILKARSMYASMYEYNFVIVHVHNCKRHSAKIRTHEQKMKCE